jgi:hypothetical protein
VFNPDMVLYFLREVIYHRRRPPEMNDHNVRIDSGKLHHLITLDRRLNGNFSRLKQVIDQGYLLADVGTGFPLEEITDEQNFISLLAYFGLLTMRGREEGTTRLEIPNQTVARLMYGFLRKAFAEADVFTTRLADMVERVRRMAYRGEWQGFFGDLADQVIQQTTVRDYLAGEKVIQGFLLAYLTVADFFTVQSETELNKGFCDLFLEPFRAKYPDIRYGYLIELKYLKRGAANEETLPELVRAQLHEGRKQLAIYAKDRRLKKAGENIQWLFLVLVFYGWELVAQETYEMEIS